MMITPELIAEYQDQVESFRRRASSKSEAEASLVAYALDLLKSMRELLPSLKASPVYAGLAFYGQFQATKPALIRKLAKDAVPSSVAIQTLRQEKALKVSAAAKTAWDLLLAGDTDSLWSAILLNLEHKPAASKGKVVRADAEEGDEGDENDDDDGDDDGDNED